MPRNQKISDHTFDPAWTYTPVSRRRFLSGSAVASVALAWSRSPLGAQEVVGNSPFYLPPFLARPTTQSIFISVLTNQLPVEAKLEYRKVSDEAWKPFGAIQSVPAFQFIHWELTGLEPSRAYRFRILSRYEAEEAFNPTEEGSFHTQREEPASYTAVLITDPHTGTFAEGSKPVQTLDTVVANTCQEEAEFVLALGDNVAWSGSREYPQNDTQGAVNAYAMYRRHIAPLTKICPHFGIIGNWAGESGKFPEHNIRMVSQVRKLFLPNPNESTYPQGGNAGEDYYAFTWGGVLFVMLNIQTYSEPSEPGAMDSLSSDVSRIEDWTLGEAQMAWLEKTLANATEPFRFVCMHHPAGGNAGNPHDTLYGRGGARCWDSGEQKMIHALMKAHGVQIFFYGHDHVFVDDEVDGIHYTLPGSCGAPWKFTPAETGYTRYWPDSGHARLEVTPRKATVTFVNLEGQDFYSFSVSPIQS